MLRVLAAPRGIDGHVRSTVLFDPLDDLVHQPDTMLLLTGVRPDEPLAIDVARAAVAAGSCAIVIKRRGADVTALITEASVLGLLVLAAADEVPWRHLDGLLLSLLGSQGLVDESLTGAGDELFELSNAMAAVIGGSVAIEDMDRRVVAYSSVPDQRIDALREQGILDRRVPEMERNLAQYRQVLGAEGVVRFPEKPDEFARSAIAIKAGARPLGTIWAIESDAGLDDAGRGALIEGARLAALKILRSLNASGFELQLRESAMLRALDGSQASAETAFRLSLPGGAQLALLGFAGTVDERGVTPLVTHLASVLSRYLFAYRPDASVATTPAAVYVLLPGSDLTAATRVAIAGRSATRAAFSDQIRVAIAHTSSDPTHLPAMRREVDDILRVTTRQTGLPAVAHLEQVHTHVLLAHIADLLVHEPRLRHRGVTAMVDHDREHHTDYAASLNAWLGAVGDVASAATRLGVHPNTLRYRLRRASELFDLELDESDDRLSLWLHLRLQS
ncbi:MAG: hypothetical protein RLZZ362_1050 [Actinomycetota bacterium]